MEYLLKGLAIGFLIALPVGPIGLLCVRRTLVNGKLSGFISGIGAATADAIYGSIAAFSLTIISHFFVANQLPLKIIGGIFLCYLGIKIYISESHEPTPEVQYKGLLNDYISTLFLTITNPVTILFFTGIFAGIGLAKLNYMSSILLVAGLFIGSAIWWTILCTMFGFFKTKLSTQTTSIINKISGAIIIIFGITGLVSTFIQ